MFIREMQLRRSAPFTKVWALDAYLFWLFYPLANSTSPTLWAGTNSGQILVFLISRPASKDAEKRKEEKITAMLGKEIQLRHRAPVLTIQVLDSNCQPLSDKNKNSTDHKVVIAR